MNTDGAPRLAVYEVPRPSPRTRREMATLGSAGFDVSVVHGPKHTNAVGDWGFRSVPASLDRGHRLRRDLQRRASAAESHPAEQNLAKRVAQEALATPTPQLAARSADLNILVHEWLVAAEALAGEGAHVLWAADLDALPAAVWAKHATSGSRVVYDAHELFMRLDYLDPLQLPEWDRIARDFVPHADLVLTVCDGIADILRAEYGAREVLVVPNLAVPGAPGDGRLRRLAPIPDDAPLAVHIGNVVPNREPQLVVGLLQRLPELHVAFLGEVRQGQDDRLRSMSAEAGVTDRLHFVPPVPVDQLVTVIQDANLSLILYSPSTSQNLRLAMPHKLFDSLAAGVPAVAATGTAAGDFLIREGVGRVFDDGEEASLADAVKALLDDPAEARACHARRADFLWPVIEERLVNSISQTAAMARPGVLTERRVSDPSIITSSAGAGAPIPWSKHPIQRARKAAAWRLRRWGQRLEP